MFAVPERLLSRATRSLSALVQGGTWAVLVVDAADCSPEDCARHVSRGRGVVVLAAVTDPGEEAKYLAAGACGYFPASMDSTALLAAIDAACPGASPNTAAAFWADAPSEDGPSPRQGVGPTG